MIELVSLLFINPKIVFRNVGVCLGRREYCVQDSICASREGGHIERGTQRITKIHRQEKEYVDKMNGNSNNFIPTTSVKHGLQHKKQYTAGKSQSHRQPQAFKWGRDYEMRTILQNLSFFYPLNKDY
ncbi:hypothetical protein AVEN_26745-1 [Araneus ventricosus]|uniref:Uncharacterized protein n=1 Tax=Araneus ventricosus TaxID=182803 RepID=A0A4Y2H865_ARAVE|nr:hypothetical protein AVEN_26745-1 [Araneus ventricosus]